MSNVSPLKGLENLNLAIDAWKLRRQQGSYQEQGGHNFKPVYIYKDKEGGFFVGTEEASSALKKKGNNLEKLEISQIAELADDLFSEIDEENLTETQKKRLYELAEDIISSLARMSEGSEPDPQKLQQLQTLRKAAVQGQLLTPFVESDAKSSGEILTTTSKKFEGYENRQLLKKKIEELGRQSESLANSESTKATTESELQQKLEGQKGIEKSIPKNHLAALKRWDDLIQEIQEKIVTLREDPQKNKDAILAFRQQQKQIALARQKLAAKYGLGEVDQEIAKLKTKRDDCQERITRYGKAIKALELEIASLKTKCGFPKSKPNTEVAQDIALDPSRTKVKVKEVVRRTLSEVVLVPLYNKEARERDKSRYFPRVKTVFTPTGQIPAGAELAKGSSKIVRDAGEEFVVVEFQPIRIDPNRPDKARKEMENEVAMHDLLKDVPGCMQVHHSISYTDERTGEANTNYVFVMTRAQGNLEKHLEGRQLSAEEQLDYALQIADVVSRVNAKGVIHVDLKLENFLVINGKIVLADFGSARYVGADPPPGCIQATRSEGIDQFAGTPAFQSPETHKAKVNPSHEAAAVDAQIAGKGESWSLGCVLYQLCYPGKPLPWMQAKDLGGTLSKLPSTFSPFDHFDPPKTEKSDIDKVIEGLLRVDPEERITTEQAKERLAGIKAAKELTILT